ncbi:hypothetical protein F230042K4_07130 [Mediterraneibacter glycyrrhizinilyticus]|uniref:hypothetical protein n=1 Tax=Mediterraneibacter glycyrrhizinilyticus TaxID=342942 RepID=UPI0036F43DA5
MNNLKQLRDRLQTNYGDCHISYVPGQLTVKFGKGTILADGIRTEFQEDGQPIQEVTIANDDDLYEQMEAFLLYLKEGGAAAAQPESDKLRRNPTYRSASEALQKNGKRLLFALGTLEVLIFLSALFFGGSTLHYILFLLVPFLAMIPISWIQRACIKKHWICPHCQNALPISGTRFSPAIQYVAHCPCCKNNLETEAIPEPYAESQTDSQSGSDSEQDAESGSFSQEEPSFGTESAAESSAPLPTAFPKARGKWACRISGLLLLLYLAVIVLFFMTSVSGIPLVNLITGVCLHIPVVILVVALFICGMPHLSEFTRPQAVIRERPSILIVGFIGWVFGIALIFMAFAVCAVPPLDLVLVLVLYAAGLAFFLCGIWALLAVKNRALFLYENGNVRYLTSFGRLKEFSAKEIASIRLSVNGSVQFLNTDGRKLFSVEKNMQSMDALVNWIETHDISFGLTKQMEEKVIQDAGIVEPKQWREEYRSWMHDHIKPIRFGLILTVLFLLIGSVLPFILYIRTDFKFSSTVYLSALSPLPLLIYILIFAPVINLNGKPKGATKEWISMHANLSAPLLLIPGLWLIAMFFYGFNDVVLTVVDFGKFLVLWLVICALFGILYFFRTPKRLRGEGSFIFLILLLLFSYPMAYGLNLALCTPAEHYPAEIVSQEIEQDEDEDSPDYVLTVRLDDGTETDIEVVEELYQLAYFDTELVVCERKSIFGIRMVDLHLSDFGEMGE